MTGKGLRARGSSSASAMQHADLVGRARAAAGQHQPDGRAAGLARGFYFHRREVGILPLCAASPVTRSDSAAQGGLGRSLICFCTSPAP